MEILRNPSKSLEILGNILLFSNREMSATLDIRRFGAFRSSWLWLPADVSYNEVVINKCRITSGWDDCDEWWMVGGGGMCIKTTAISITRSLGAV